MSHASTANVAHKLNAENISLGGCAGPSPSDPPTQED